MSNEAAQQAARALDEAADDLLDPHSTTKPASTRDAFVAWLRDRAAALRHPRMTCPACGGAGIVDTSPPGVETAPWLATDTDEGAS